MTSRSEFKASQATAQTEKSQLAADAVLQQLIAMTPNQAAVWVSNNVATLAQAKAVLQIFAKVLVLLARKIN